MQRACWFVLVVIFLAASGCSEKTPETSSPKSPETSKPVQKPAVALSAPARELAVGEDKNRYPATVGQMVEEAVFRGLEKSVHTLADKLDPPHNTSNFRVLGEKERAKGDLLTLWYSGNVRGEREDCGCKKNPRGGLARKATILDQAPERGRIMDRPDAQVVVDAGDLFYKTPGARTFPHEKRRIAQIEAMAVLEAFNLIGCDAYLVGEYDLAMGVESLLGLHKKAKFPWISANLRKKGEEKLLFKPFVTTRVGAHKVLMVGVTNPKGDAPRYYDQAGVEVEDPVVALRAQVKAIEAEKADFVVLLSNLGLSQTYELLDKGGVEGLTVNAALVSNTGRQTSKPLWARGIPVMESGSRGKFLGRADFHIVEGDMTFETQAPPEAALARSYVASASSLQQARRSAQRVLHGPDSVQKKRILQNLKLAHARLKGQEKGLPSDVPFVSPQPEGESWLHAQVVPVDLAVEQRKDVRNVLDRYIKRADAAKKK